MTDNTTEHVLNIYIQAFDPVLRKCVVYLWDIVKVYTEGRLDIRGDSARIWSLIKGLFHSRGVNMIRGIIISSDGAPVYVGVNKSVATRENQDEPDLGSMKCKSLFKHLCARDALDCSPGEVVIQLYEDFLIMYYKPFYIVGEGQDVTLLDPEDEAHMLDVKDIKFGPIIDEAFGQLTVEEEKRPTSGVDLSS
ncbi:hypothetical protein QAD02_018158 [Eretmocerus hayati]|uniref:Uncharacterized protein n=1 Tax=Eretmocerus hayati TaxID=131215 RepID=A0ACC2PH62_9HYME|nr:hypothetical protein QAD02_018158 [Eretmocerus hayati]